MMNKTDLNKLNKAQLIALLQEQAQAVVDLQEQAEQARQEQEQAEQEQSKRLQELTGLSADRLQYEENKYNEQTACMYQFPELFTADTVQFRAERAQFLQELDKRYIREIVQNSNDLNRQERRSAGKSRAGRSTGANKAGKASTGANKAEHELYSVITAGAEQAGVTLTESDRYLTGKSRETGKTVCRIYLQRGNVKFLVKEVVAKKAGLQFDMIKFNLPASVICETAEQVQAVFKAF